MWQFCDEFVSCCNHSALLEEGVHFGSGRHGAGSVIVVFQALTKSPALTHRI